jgi:predicted PurR-regulated permease PerM
MQLERNIVFWIAAFAVCAGLLWLLSPILLPFVVGMAIAYLLDPLANRLIARGVSLIVAAVVLLGQFIEGYVLAPKLVGKSIGLHPVWLIFALFAFGYLFGFVGLLLAVPLAAAVGVLTRFAVRRYLESPLYTGTRAS